MWIRKKDNRKIENNLTTKLLSIFFITMLFQWVKYDICLKLIEGKWSLLFSWHEHIILKNAPSTKKPFIITKNLINIQYFTAAKQFSVFDRYLVILSNFNPIPSLDHSILRIFYFFHSLLNFLYALSVTANKKIRCFHCSSIVVCLVEHSMHNLQSRKINN